MPGPVHEGQRGVEHDAASVMRLCPRPRGGAEVRQFRERHVHAERPGPALVATDRLDELGRQLRRLQQALVQQLRIDVGGHRPRAQHLPGLQFDADRAAAFDQYPRDWRIDGDPHAARPCFGGHRLRDCAHAANGVAPFARLAVDLAETVMQKHVGGARCIGTGVVADDGVPAQHSLERFGLEPAVEPVAGALGEDVNEVTLALARQPAELQQQLGAGHQVAPAFDDEWPAEFGRCLQHPLLQLLGQPIEPRVIRRQALGIAGGELGDRRLRRCQVTAEAQRSAIGRRNKVRKRSFNNAQAVLDKPQVADHLGVQQADRVARGRIAEAGVELLGHCGAADDAAPLDDVHL